MKNLRNSIFMLLLTMGVFLNIERLDVGTSLDIINLQSFVYLIGALAVFSTILMPEKWRPNSLIWMAFWIIVYIVLKLSAFNVRPLFGGINTYLTVTEIAMISLLVLTAIRVAGDLIDVEDTVANVTLIDVSERVKRMEEAEDDISKEFARSRRYASPLSVMVLKIQTEEVAFNLQRTAEEILQGMMKRYATNKLIRLLDQELRRTDMVLEKTKDNQVVLVLPETNALGTEILADRLRDIVKNQIGIDISTGFASFPDEALTFNDLLKQAEIQYGALQVEGSAKATDESAAND
ncbi:MAG: hypothetical protein H8E28_15775 [Anaerolineae bacterium]|nr:hypothetical protein [Anaerolineae bacterium]MBL6965026.1 hypothetical protein [Anaerolineales bacterium]